MTDKELNRYLEWVAANLPLVAMRESAELKAIVKQAVNDTQVYRVLLGVASAVVGVFIGAGIMEYVAADDVSNRSYTFVVTFSAVLLAYFSSIASEVLVHRKIQLIAESQ